MIVRKKIDTKVTFIIANRNKKIQTIFIILRRAVKMLQSLNKGSLLPIILKAFVEISRSISL